MKQISIEEINEVLKGTIVGLITTKITAPEQLEVANESEISFIGNKKYEKLWVTSKAGVAVGDNAIVNTISEKLIQQYEERIKELKETIAELKAKK